MSYAYFRIDYQVLSRTNRPERGARNEDAVLFEGRIYQGEITACGALNGEEPHLFALSDGLHGTPCAAYASRSLLTELHHLWSRDRNMPYARMAVQLQAGFCNRAMGKPEAQGMAATLLSAQVQDLNMRLSHVGDSRAWHIREGWATRLTRDHTVMECMRRSGESVPDNADETASLYQDLAIFFMALPFDEAPEQDVIDLDMEPGDLILIATDGLSVLDDQAISDCSKEGFDAMAMRLFDAAVKAGSDDNLSLIILRIANQDRPHEPG